MDPEIAKGVALACANQALLVKILGIVAGTISLPVVASIAANFRKKLPPWLVNILDAVALNFIKQATTAAKTAPALALAVLLAACTVSNGSVSNGWTVTSAVNVTYAAGAAIEADLLTLEPQMPAQKALIKAFGQALSTGIQSQAAAMVAGESAGQQTMDTVINVVIASLPNTMALIDSAHTAGLTLNWVADINAFITQAPGVVQAVAKANSPAGAAAADAAASLVALQAAAAAL
jgi:hypothetical protein